MTVEYIRYHVPGDTGEFERAARSLASAPQCADYEVSRDTGDPDTYLLRITWTSAADRPRVSPADLLPGFPPVGGPRLYEPTGLRGPGGSVPSLYDWAGGTAAFERLTSRFYELVAADDLIGPLFAHMDPAHPRWVAMWLSEVFGGPARYTADRGGYAHMLAHHVGKGITEPQRRRWVSLLTDAADEVGLPADPEFRAAFMSYIEWGTRLAVANSQPGATPPERAPVPRWGWGVAPPYKG
ncbi:group II truncated hemoglobin [Actinoplanes sp. CA-131856]